MGNAPAPAGEFERTISERVFNDPSYSVRRFLVDNYFHKAVGEISENALVLDVGGKKNGKRGYFDISFRPMKMVYANISADNGPDILCRAESLAAKTGKFDAVICAETLEHVTDPQGALNEMARSLRPGGTAFITVPFMYHVHADPHDYGRYTSAYWQRAAALAGFSMASVISQGGFYVTAANMYKTWMWGFKPESIWGKFAYQIAWKAMPRAMKFLLRLDAGIEENSILGAHSIGYCMKLVK